jgi:hypothetical protein
MAKYGRRNPQNVNNTRDKAKSLNRDTRIRFEETKSRQNISNSQYIRVRWEDRVKADEEQDEYNE